MNYNELKQNYPQAFDQFVNWYRKYFDLSMFSGFPKLDLGLLEQIISDDNSNLTRDLYDFFDSEKVYVGVWPERDFVKKSIVFMYSITNGKQHHILNDDTVYIASYDTRTEAEEAAFTKAFEILEQQLNK